ncbi:MAG: hypothetical protein WCO57_05810 [Verrucomicrobiota bacterium]
MARRASSRLHPGVFIGIAAAVVLAIVAGQSFFKKKKPRFGDVSPLNVEDFLENGNSLRGNEYSLTGKIDEKLRWTTKRGQIVSLRVSTPGGDELIGVEIPPDFNNLNIEREQRYALRIKVRQGGIPVATAVTRL